MTRQEEIKKVAYAQYCNSKSICFTLMCDSFKQGAEWADKHPNLSSLWHDASEKPHVKKWLLVQLDKDDYKILCLKDLYIDLWCDWCKIFNFIRWAYIEDLLLK